MMVFYLTGVFVVLLAGLFTIGKLHKKYRLYEDDSERRGFVILAAVYASVWPVSLPSTVLGGIVYMLYLGSLKLLRVFES